MKTQKSKNHAKTHWEFGHSDTLCDIANRKRVVPLTTDKEKVTCKHCIRKLRNMGIILFYKQFDK